MRIFMAIFFLVALFSALSTAFVATSSLASASVDEECLRAAYGDLPPALLADPVLAQSMAQDYPLEPLRPDFPEGLHPGRVRSYALLRHLYGGNKAEVQARLQRVTLLGHCLTLSPVAAKAFTRVGQRLEATVREKPELRSYILPLGGFFWRNIAGEERLSPHSFGIAVDLNPAKGPYWSWSAPEKRKAQGSRARANYPHEIVDAFEAEGFIWGGKWHEYDLMHFEYRPELLCKARKKARQVIETIEMIGTIGVTGTTDSEILRESGKN